MVETVAPQPEASKPDTSFLSPDRLNIEAVFQLAEERLGHPWSEATKTRFRELLAQHIGDADGGKLIPGMGEGSLRIFYMFVYFIQSLFRTGGSFDWSNPGQFGDWAKGNFDETIDAGEMNMLNRGTIRLFNAMKESGDPDLAAVAEDITGQRIAGTPMRPNDRRNLFEQLATGITNPDGTAFVPYNGGSLNLRDNPALTLNQNQIAPPPATPAGAVLPTQPYLV